MKKPRTDLSGEQILKRIKFWHPLTRNVIDLIARDEPGLYVIKKGDCPVYVGRSLKSIRVRLSHHLPRFDGLQVGMVYVRHVETCKRLEYRLVRHCRRLYKVENRINASIGE